MLLLHMKPTDSQIGRYLVVSMRRKQWLPWVIVVVILIFFYYHMQCEKTPNAYMVPRQTIKYIYDHQQKAIPYDNNMPIIFIGGMFYQDNILA